LLNSTQKKVEGLNFDMRKNLIDYDSVLSNQRELIYKQRDQILLNSENYKIVSNMCKEVASQLVNECMPTNTDVQQYVEQNKIADLINTALCINIIAPNIFKNKKYNDAVKITSEIIKTYIDIKSNLLGSEQANGIIKEILLGNLDAE
jgi:preprotein translocase subunit SecA